MYDFCALALVGSLNSICQVEGHSPALNGHYIVFLQVVYASMKSRRRTAKREEVVAFAFQDKETVNTLRLIDYGPLKECFKGSEWELDQVNGVDSVIRDEDGNQEDMIPHRVLLIDGKLKF